MTTIEHNELARRTTLNELCEAWQKSTAEIQTAYGLLVEAGERLRLVFAGRESGFDIVPYNTRPDFSEPQEAIAHLKKQVWGALMNRLELRKILSLKRIAEMDRQIESGQGLPEITLPNVLAILESNLANSGQFMEEKVLECYEWLRPGGWSRTKYKTNEKSMAAGVGSKVVLTWAVEHNYSTRGFQVNYSKVDNLRALDQVFHLLDGKPQSDASWRGPLVDAIGAQTNFDKNDFATDYFRGRCFRNQNLHLEFTRPDLVAKFNAIAGGARLKEAA